MMILTSKNESECRNVLVGVDRSRQSMDALRYVGRLFAKSPAGVTILHVVKPPATGRTPCNADPVPGDWRDHENGTTRELTSFAKRILIDIGWSEDRVGVCTPQKEIGVARDIIRLAETGYDAVVVGRTGTSRWRDAVLGGTAFKLLNRLTGVPLCVVSGTPEPERIMFGLDSSADARQAVRAMGDLMGAGVGEAILFHAIRGLGLPADMPYLAGTKALADRNHAAEDGKMMAALFDECRNRLISKGPPNRRVRTMIASNVGSRAWSLVNEAKRLGCGTIVLGRRDVPRMEGFFTGRLGNKVVKSVRNTAVWVVAGKSGDHSTPPDGKEASHVQNTQGVFT